MDPQRLTTRQLAEALTLTAVGCRDRLSRPDWDALDEVTRQLRGHERLLAEVLPDRRQRLTVAEGTKVE